MPVALHEFLSANRAELIARCRAKVHERRAAASADNELEHGIPLFMDQLMETLRTEQTGEPMRSRRLSGPSGGVKPMLSEMGASAARHGHELFEHGFTVDQVVHDYGDLCQAITELAFAHDANIQVDEFRTLNRCLDNAIADAVTEFAYRRDVLIANEATHTLDARLELLAHGLRDRLHVAMLAVTALKTGNVGWNGPTGALVDRSLHGLRLLIEQSLAEVRVTAGLPARCEPIPLAAFIADVQISNSLEAHARGCGLSVSPVDAEIAVHADRALLFSAVSTLLHNAFRFTKPGTDVSLSAFASADRILIDIEDRCGGLRPGASEKIFQPAQFSADQSGIGLELSMCRRSVEANHGTLRVHDLPGTGCIFTIDLPRHAVPHSAPSHAAPSATTKEKDS